MTTSSSDPASSANAPQERARSLSEQTSATVRQAADVLEQELSAGLEEARRLQKKLTDQRRIEPGDLDEVSARLRGNAHLLIDMVSERFTDLGADDVQDIAQRFAKDAHGAFDALVDLVSAAPDLVNQLADRLGVSKGGDNDQQSPRAMPTPDATEATATRSATAATAARKPAAKATKKAAAKAIKKPAAKAAKGTSRTPRG